jgi:hypothetical protein
MVSGQGKMGEQLRCRAGPWPPVFVNLNAARCRRTVTGDSKVAEMLALATSACCVTISNTV